MVSTLVVPTGHDTCHSGRGFFADFDPAERVSTVRWCIDIRRGILALLAFFASIRSCFVQQALRDRSARLRTLSVP